MYCSNCGKQLEDGVRFCKYCGTPTSLKGVSVSEQPDEFDRKQVEQCREIKVTERKNQELMTRKRAMENKQIGVIIGVAVVVVGVTRFIIPANQYKTAEKLLASGDYDGAAVTFGKAAGYKDAHDRSMELWNQFADRKTVDTSGSHTVGLRSDGTVVATGNNTNGQCNVSDWQDIVAVSAGSDCTIALKADGTVVAVGDNINGQCDVGDWTGIKVPSAASDISAFIEENDSVTVDSLSRTSSLYADGDNNSL